MKKLLFNLLAIFIIHVNAYSVVPTVSVSVPPSTVSVVRPVRSPTKQLRIAQMKSFVGLTPEQYGTLKGKKLNFMERFTFKLTQRRMKKMLKHYEYGDEPNFLMKLSWLVKGLVLGPIALILGYLFLKDEQRVLIKWIWFGFIGFTITLVAYLLTL